MNKTNDAVIDELKAISDQVRALAAPGHDHDAHEAQDRLYRVALEHLRRGEGDSAQVATVALSTEDVEFSHWYS